MVDLTKPVQTRDGRKVRILCTDANSAAGPIVGLVLNSPNQEYVEHWFSDGAFMADKTWDDRDLVNAPPPKRKVKVEVRLYLVANQIRAHACASCDDDRWHPALDGREIAAFTTIEMEYEVTQS
jgi:hypothetical protein